jgi:hypothetical protein
MDAPFPIPRSRYEALSNALFYAKRMAETMGAIPPGLANSTQAQVWAAIAQAFSEDEQQANTDAFQRMTANQEPAGMPTAGYQTAVALPAYMSGRNGTVEVSAWVWDALRYVAMQHLAQSPQGLAVVDRDESTNSGNWEIAVEEVGLQSPITVRLHFR